MPRPTRDELLARLQALQAENGTLRRANEEYRTALNRIYGQTRVALGIEAAAAAREALKQKGK
jgi:hypothetical protein